MATNLDKLLELADDKEFFGSLESQTHGNLGEVFGQSILNESQSISLKYQAPKSLPSNAGKSKPSDKTEEWITSLVKMAEAYRDSELIGKVVVAILLSRHGSMGKIISYKTKTNILLTKTLNTSKQSVYKTNNYLQFYDDSNHYWSLMFQSSDREEFAEKLKAFHVEIVDSNEDLNKDDTKPDDDKKENLEVVKYDGENIQNSPSNNKDEKTSLISRMAKMGKPMPFIQENKKSDASYTAETRFSSDSSEAEEIVIAHSKKPELCPRPYKLPPPKQYLQTYVSNMSHESSSNPLDSQLVQMLLSENRTQNSETRINLCKLESKIEKVLDKLDVIKIASSNSGNEESNILDLEEKILNLKKENQKLKKSLEEYQKENSQQNTEEILRIYHAKLDSLGIRKSNDLNEVLQKLLDIIRGLQDKITDSANDSQAQAKCEELQASVVKLSLQNAEVLSRQNELEKNLEGLEKLMNETNIENINLKKNLEDVNKQNLENVQKTRLETILTIKATMNRINSTIVEEIDKTSSLDTEKVLAFIGKTIKEETLKALVEINK